MSGAADELPPNSTSIEEGTLGCVLISPDAQSGLAILHQCEPNDFYDLGLRLIATTLFQCPGRSSLDTELVVALTAAGQLQAVGGADRITRIQQSVTTPLSIDALLPELKNLSRRRAVLQHAKVLRDHALDLSSDIALLPPMTAQQSATVETRAWVDLAEVPETDKSILLGPGRWAGRGGSTLMVGGTGGGKSTMVSTLAHSFAINRPCLGFVPNGPLKSVVIQAEDDDGDLAAMSAGIRYALNPSEEELDLIRRNVRIVTESALTGIAFLNKRVLPLLRQEKPDLLWINPLHSYSGVDLKEAENVALFCRNTLNPMLQAAGCHCFIAHHTPKPPKEGKGYSDLDLAYAGAGSADLANWAREVIVLQSRAPKLFDMHCVKRGQHLGWKDADGNGTRSKTITYGEAGKQYWRLADEVDMQQAGAKRYSETAALEHVPVTGIDKATLVDTLADEFDVSSKTARDCVKGLARIKLRKFGTTSFKCALVKETKRPRGDVYPGESGRSVVWVTKLSHFEKEAREAA